MTKPARPSVWRSKPYVLITGGCGFIGSNLADALARRGQSVLAADNLSRAGAEENAGWLKKRHPGRITIEKIDVRDADAVDRVVLRASAVLHLAAQVAVTTSLKDPLEDFGINAQGTLNVLDSLRRRNPKAPLLFASTNKVYGRLLEHEELTRSRSRYAPANARFQHGVAEDTPLDFYSPYGCSKGAADQYVRDYARVFGLRTAVLRMSCVYGLRQFGTEDQGWIAHFLLKAMHDSPITIYGDGCQVRDALAVEDAVTAWLSVLDRIDAVRGRVFNLGGGPTNSVSLRELVELMADLHGERADIRFAPWRPGDQPWYVSDIRAIGAALDWSPRINLPAGLRSLDRWLTDRFARPIASAPLLEARA